MTNKKPSLYMGNLNNKMTLRLTDELLAYVNEMSDRFAISPSDFIRQCIAQNKDQRDQAKLIINSLGDEFRRKLEDMENGFDRNINNKL